MSNRVKTPVKATATSARITEALIELDGATVTELDDYLPLSKSSIHNHLETLETLGFVVRDGWTYRVSLRFLQIGGVARRQHPLYEVGLPTVRSLADSSGLVASLVVVERSEAICLYSAIGEKAETAAVEAGDTLPFHCTAAGKALLAAIPFDRMDDVIATDELKKRTEKTLTTRDALEREIRTIQSRGIAFEDEEWRTDLRGVADVILDIEDYPLGAISVTGPSELLSGKRFRQDIPGLVISSSNKIQKALRNK